MDSILLHLENSPFINVQFIFTKVYVCKCMYILRTHSISCIVIQCACFVLLCHYVVDFFSLFSLHILMLCCIIIFSNMSSKVLSHTDIPLSSDIFLDSLIIDIHVLSFLFASAIVMLAF